MTKRSQNLYASLLHKACGVDREGVGSWASGERALLDDLERRGVPRGGLRLLDGSGLSKENRLSASAVAHLLVSMDRDVLRGPVLYDALAVPGEEGTLQKRFRDVPAAARTRIHAKTGTLGKSGVHAIAGYVDGVEKKRGFAFAFLCNGKGDGRDLVDDLVK